MTRIRARSLAASLLYLVTSFFLKSQAVRLRNGKPKIVWRLLSFAVSRWDTDKNILIKVSARVTMGRGKKATSRGPLPAFLSFSPNLPTT